MDEYITGQDYGREYTTFSTSWPAIQLVNSEANAEAQIEDDYDVEMEWRYKVETPNGTDEWIAVRDLTGLTYYLILDDPKGDSKYHKNEIIKYACSEAEDEDTAPGACEEVKDAIYGDYDWHGNCHELASNFVHMCHCLGIDAKCHRWSKSAPVAVGSMFAQRTRSFDPAGPTHGNQIWEFNFHQWAESGGKQYDPTSDVTHDSTWDSYEDWLYTDYLRITNVEPLEGIWDANSPGQSSGCEPTGVHKDNTQDPTILEDWLNKPQ